MSAPSYIVTVPADHPDAALIALCNEATRLYYATSRFDQRGNPTGLGHDPEHDRAISERVTARHALVERIMFMPATTLEGMRAKAELMAPLHALDDPMVASLVSDLIGRKVGAMTTRGRARHMRDQRPGRVVRGAVL